MIFNLFIQLAITLSSIILGVTPHYLLDNQLTTAISTFIERAMYFNDFIPVAHLINCILIILGFHLMVLIYNGAIGIIRLLPFVKHIDKLKGSAEGSSLAELEYIENDRHGNRIFRGYGDYDPVDIKPKSLKQQYQMRLNIPAHRRKK